jgi:hypothetical protein
MFVSSAQIRKKLCKAKLSTSMWFALHYLRYYLPVNQVLVQRYLALSQIKTLQELYILRSDISLEDLLFLFLGGLLPETLVLLDI